MHCRKEGIISDNFKSWFFYESCPRAGAAIFKSSLLKSHLFDESLSRYEDAKSLFDILRNHRMTYSPQPVMVYSQDNLNLSKRAKEFSMDFISCLDFNNKPYWECILLGNLVNQGIKTYPELSKQIKKQYIAYKKYLLLANWYIYIRKLKNLTSCFREYIK